MDGMTEPGGVEMRQHAPTSTRSGRTVNSSARLIQALIVTMATVAGIKNNGGSIEGEIFCLVVLFPDGKVCNKDPLYAFKASTNPGRGSWKIGDKGQYFPTRSMDPYKQEDGSLPEKY
jgi:hypothetical protein